ncbi:hypothetical protein, partial [Escherichia coli]
LRQKQKKLIMLPSETMIWQPEFTDKTLSRKPGAVQQSTAGIQPHPQRIERFLVTTMTFDCVWIQLLECCIYIQQKKREMRT